MSKLPGEQSMRTPDWLFELLNKRFGPFKLDAAASPHNAKCRRFYTEREDGLSRPWRDPTFCNPPFKHFGDWMAKAQIEWALYLKRSCLIGPAGCSQSWFHNYTTDRIALAPTPRINFCNPDGSPTRGAMHNVMIYLFGYSRKALTERCVELYLLELRQ